MYTLHLAYRYLKSRMVVFLAVGGVAIGVIVLIVVMSVMDGFGAGIRERLRGTSADLLLEDPTNVGIEGYESLIDAISTQVEGVEACAPYVERAAMITSFVQERDENGAVRRRPSGRAVVGTVKGIDPARAGQVGDLDTYLQYSSTGTRDLEPGRFRALLGWEVLYNNGAYGLPAELVITAPVYGEISSEKKVYTYRFRPIGRFQSGQPDYDKSYILVALKDAQDLMLMGDTVSGIEIKVAQGQPVDRVQAHIQSLLGTLGRDFTVKRWEEKREEVLDALALEKVLSGLIIFLVIVVASFGLITILDMTVANKKHEIGILSALGATRRGVVAIFLMAGVFIGAIGGAIGGVLGALIVRNLPAIQVFFETLFGFHIFPDSTYNIRFIPAQWNPNTCWAVVLATVVVCTLASVIPALHAGRYRPVDCLTAGR